MNSSSAVKFIQNNCLVLSLRLNHPTIHTINEVIWTQLITNKLNEISTVLYAGPSYTDKSNLIKSHASQLDLVLSSSNVKALALLLYNLRGLKIGKLNNLESELRRNRKYKPPSDSFFTMNKDTDKLTSISDELSERWQHNQLMENARNNVKESCIKPISILSWYFSPKPTEIFDHYIETTGETFSLNKYVIPYSLPIKGRDNPDDRLIYSKREDYKTDENEYHDPSNNYLRILTYSYLFSSSLSPNLQRWFQSVNIPQDKIKIMTSKEKEKLDLMLFGFKGLN